MYITQALHRSVAQTPNQPATICGDRVRTFSEHVDRIARLAGGLRELGVSTDDRVGILSLNTDRYIESLFAIPWADAVLNPINIRWSPAEIAYSLEDSETATLIVDDAFLPMVPELRRLTPGLTTVIHAGDNPAPDDAVNYEELIDTSARIPDARRSGQSLAGVFYTGGTTGAPKGVALSHTNLTTAALGALAWRNTVLHADSPRSLHVAPMFHLADFAFLIMTTLVGGTNIALPGFVPEKVGATIQQHGVTDTVLVPTMIQMLVDNPALASYDLCSLRSVIYGASPISPALLERAAKALPGADFFQVYGMTELAAVATMLQASDHGDPKRRRSAGRAMPITELRVVDESDVEVPAGTVGEITVRGSQVMVGYWRKPEATAEALRGGWLHTGDAGYLDSDGYLYIVDRFKDMIISGGENVYSTEVENALAQHPAVAAPAVIGVPDEQWGEIVHAVVVLKPGATATADELQDHVRTLIAGYKVPRSIEFATELPISGAGKVLKRALRDSYRKSPSA